MNFKSVWVAEVQMFFHSLWQVFRVILERGIFILFLNFLISRNLEQLVKFTLETKIQNSPIFLF